MYFPSLSPSTSSDWTSSKVGTMVTPTKMCTFRSKQVAPIDKPYRNDFQLGISARSKNKSHVHGAMIVINMIMVTFDSPADAYKKHGISQTPMVAPRMKIAVSRMTCPSHTRTRMQGSCTRTLVEFEEGAFSTKPCINFACLRTPR